MDPIQAIILGIVQGLTEFFPVSSSGHLVIFQQMMGLKEPVLLFDVSVHMGTLAAIVIYFYRELGGIVTAFIRFLALRMTGKTAHFSQQETEDIRMAWMLIAGSIPTAIIGAGLQMISDTLFSSLVIVGVALLCTGVVILATKWVDAEKTAGKALSLKQSVLIGTVQGLAVVPGISRSGSTISAALFLGLSRDMAVRFSFLLSIPAIVGALGLQILTNHAGIEETPVGIIFLGLLTSLVVGYIALSLLVKMVNKGQLHLFTPYCFALGVFAIISGL